MRRYVAILYSLLEYNVGAGGQTGDVKENSLSFKSKYLHNRTSYIIVTKNIYQIKSEKNFILK
jgi:hypothetical protein